MIKLVNRLLVIAVIAFGSWFLIQQWDKVEQNKDQDPTPNKTPISTQLPTTKKTEIANEKNKTTPEKEDSLLVFKEDPTNNSASTEAKKKNTTDFTKTMTNNSKNKTISTTTTPKKCQNVFKKKSSMKVYLFDGGFDVSVSRIEAGQITFTVRNDGRMSHDFSIKGVRNFGRIVPGEIKEFTQHLKPGKYTLFSPRDIDQSLDMRETLTVESTK